MNPSRTFFAHIIGGLKHKVIMTSAKVLLYKKKKKIPLMIWHAIYIVDTLVFKFTTLASGLLLKAGWQANKQITRIDTRM